MVILSSGQSAPSAEPAESGHSSTVTPTRDATASGDTDRFDVGMTIKPTHKAAPADEFDHGQTIRPLPRAIPVSDDFDRGQTLKPEKAGSSASAGARLVTSHGTPMPQAAGDTVAICRLDFSLTGVTLFCNDSAGAGWAPFINPSTRKRRPSMPLRSLLLTSSGRQTP